jgi:uncharacterized protein
MKQLDPKAVWLFALHNILGLLILSVWLGGALMATLVSNGIISIPAVVGIVLSDIVLVLLVSFGIAKLSYRFYRYEMREDCFRKESGIIWKKYVSIPYERIQNVDIHRGILARLLGLSDLQVQTAGASAVMGRGGPTGMYAEGRLPGLSKEEAELMRDELIKRARSARNQGL